jgi:hypothetical protein
LLADGDEKYADVNNVRTGFKKKEKKKVNMITEKIAP